MLIYEHNKGMKPMTKFTDASEAVKFIHAGNATVTFRSLKTDTHFTFRVRQKDNDNGTKTPHFVSVLNGPDNTSDYMYIGHITKNGEFSPGRKGLPGAPSFKAFSWVYANLRNGVIPDELEVYHKGKCGRCGRKLTVPESIRDGIGPECRKHV